MPYFTRKIEPSGLVLNVQVGVSEERRQSLLKNNLSIPSPVGVKGIIDTGASRTCVDPLVVQKLELKTKGDTAVFTPSTGEIPVMMEHYDVSVMIYRTVEDPPFAVANLPVIKSNPMNHQGYQVLIGRDILSQCLLTYDGHNRQYSLAF